jgi:GDP-mannose transporter
MSASQRQGESSFPRIPVQVLPPPVEEYDGGDYRRPPAAMVMRRVASVSGGTPRGRSRSPVPSKFSDARRNSSSIYAASNSMMNNQTKIAVNKNITKQQPPNNDNQHIQKSSYNNTTTSNPFSPNKNDHDFVSIGVNINYNKEGEASAQSQQQQQQSPSTTSRIGGGVTKSDSSVLASGSIHVAVSSILTSAAASSNAAPTTRKLRQSMKKQSIISSCAFIVCSTAMVMCNKGLASVFPESSAFPTLLVAWQCLISILLCLIGSRLGHFTFDAWSLETTTRYLPVSCIFVAMVFSSFMALAHLTVPTVTVVKNLTNILIVLGDWYAFGNQPTSMVYLSFGFMVMGAAAPVFNDLSFSVVGYGWMTVNCFSTAAYVLALRWISVKSPPPRATKRRGSNGNSGMPPAVSGGRPLSATLKTRATAAAGGGIGVGGAKDAPKTNSPSLATNSRFEVVLYNNSLAAPMLLCLAFSMGEMGTFLDAQASINSLNFGVLVVTSGAAGFFLNVAALWCLGSVSATTYAIVGSLNKVPIIVLGHIVYGDLVTTEGAGFVALAVAGALLYSLAKLERKSD